MLSLGLTLIVTICLSILCVYITNIKILIPHKRKKNVIYHAEEHKNHIGDKGSELVYENQGLKIDASQKKADSWTVGIAGHA